MTPGMFPTPRQRFRDHTLRQFLPKLKIMDKDIGLALYPDLCQSLSIAISRDRFNVKKYCSLYLKFSKGSKQKLHDPTLFYGKRCRRHVVLKVEIEVECRRSSHCPNSGPQFTLYTTYTKDAFLYRE
jgi:hypothetical protein